MNVTKTLLVAILLLSQVSVKGQFSLNLQFLFNGYSFSQNDNIVLLINNSSTNKQTAYLYVEISSDVEGLVGKGYSRSFVSSPGIVQFDKTSNQLFDSTLLTYDRSFEEAFIRNGELPSRNYTVCVTLFKSGNNQELAKICETLRTQKFQPPLNRFPFDRDTVSGETLTFQWIPEQPAGKGFAYRVIVSELLPNQSANSAFSQNNLFWESPEVFGQAVLFTPNARQPTAGKAYCWLVEAKSKDLILRSEPYIFYAGKKKLPTLVTKLNPKPLLNDSYLDISDNLSPNEGVIIKNGKVGLLCSNDDTPFTLHILLKDYTEKTISSKNKQIERGMNLFELEFEELTSESVGKNVSLSLFFPHGKIIHLKAFIESL